MTTITKLEQKTYQNKPQGFKVTFSDSRNGNLNEKESDKGLREGDSVIVTEIPYKSKAGVDSILYGVKLANQSAAQSASTSTPPRPQIHVGTGKSIQELKADASIKSAELMVGAFIADKVDWGQLEEKQKNLSKLLSSEIDDIFAGKV